MMTSKYLCMFKSKQSSAGGTASKLKDHIEEDEEKAKKKLQINKEDEKDEEEVAKGADVGLTQEAKPGFEDWSSKEFEDWSSKESKEWNDLRTKMSKAQKQMKTDKGGVTIF